LRNEALPREEPPVLALPDIVTVGIAETVRFVAPASTPDQMNEGRARVTTGGKYSVEPATIVRDAARDVLSGAVDSEQSSGAEGCIVCASLVVDAS
jgi:hypothetical protein